MQGAPRLLRLAQCMACRDEGGNGEDDGRGEQHVATVDDFELAMQYARCGHRCAEAVIDVYDSHSSRATIQHREQRSDSTE